MSRIERAEAALDSLARRQRYDQRNRLALLTIHGLVGLVAGLLIWAFGAPTSWIAWRGEGLDHILVIPASGGGALLLLGLSMRHLWPGLALTLEALGMSAILVWDALMMITIYEGPNPPYPIAVYAGMAGLMVVHVWTLVAYLWNRRKERP